MARACAVFLVSLALTFISAATHAQTYSAPKTPWGDPDLQGIWSGDSAFGIPLQRPESFGTRGELNDKEYADKVARDECARRQALTAVGSFRNDNGWVTKLEEDAKKGIIRPRRPIQGGLTVGGQPIPGKRTFKP